MLTSDSRSTVTESVRAQQFLRWSAVALAIGFGTHAVDHVRRGMSAATMLVMIGGGAEALSIAIAVFMVLTRRAWAAQAAIAIGFGTALASTYGHLLPTLVPGFQDSFVSPPHLGVTWYSWVSLAAAMGTGIVFGFAGIRAMRSQRAHRSQRGIGTAGRRG
jgi:hypothetical protein